MLAEIGEEHAFLTERRHMRKNLKAKIAPLKFACAEIAPLGEGYGLSVMREHRQRVTMHEILRQDIRGSHIKLIRFLQIKVVGKDIQHVRAALSDIVRQELNSVSAH